MVNFLKLQYQLGKITDEELDKLVLKGKITQEDLVVIKAGQMTKEEVPIPYQEEIEKDLKEDE